MSGAASYRISVIAVCAALALAGCSKQPERDYQGWVDADLIFVSPDEQGRIYLDLWDLVKGAKTKEEYLRACKGAIASIYASWSRDFQDWSRTFEFARTMPCPVLLCVADNATRATWLFEHLTKEYEFLRNPDDEDE